MSQIVRECPGYALSRSAEESFKIFLDPKDDHFLI